MKILNEAGMKDKIIFFVLGALLATIAYIAGDMKSVNADSATIFDKDVWIKGSLVVSGGRIAITDPSKVDNRSYIDCSVQEGVSIIRIVNEQGKDPRTHPASSLTLSASSKGVKFPTSTITLSGKNGKDRWNMWSFQPK